MAGVLSNGKGFYSPLVYVLECHRLGVALLPPTVNHSSEAFEVTAGGILVPLARMFASTYRSYGLATVRYPVLEVEANVEPFDNGKGFTLRVHRVGKPRVKEVVGISIRD